VFVGSLWARVTRSLSLVDLLTGPRHILSGEVRQRIDLGTVRPRVSPDAFRANLRAAVTFASRRGIRVVVLHLNDNPTQSGALDEGVQALRRGRVDQAKASFTLAIGREDAFSEAARLQLAAMYERAGQLDEARAVRVSPRTFHSVVGGYPIRPNAEYSAMARDVARESGVTFVDGGALLDRRPEVYVDFCHFDETGHRLIADLLAPELRALLSAASSR
jgi:hypothetical protein